MDAKTKSPTYAEFVKRYGITSAYELEALEPADLQQILVEAIEDTMDLDAYEAELEAEKTDAAGIKATRTAVLDFVRTSAA